MIEVLVGHIASGKSTYCRQKAKEGFIVLSDDAITNMVHGGNHDLYDKYLKPLYKSIEDNIFHTAIAMNLSLVIDRGVDVSIKSRQRWIALARSMDVPISALVFEVFEPEVHAKRRFAADARGRSYEWWLKTANAHAKRYEAPTTDEGFISIDYQYWDAQFCDAKMNNDHIDDTFEFPDGMGREL